MRCCSRSRPRPAPSAPALFDATVRFVAPCASSASIRIRGTPLRPKPPTARLAPSGMSATASCALATVLSTQVSQHAGDVTGGDAALIVAGQVTSEQVRQDVVPPGRGGGRVPVGAEDETLRAVPAPETQDELEVGAPGGVEHQVLGDLGADQSLVRFLQVVEGVEDNDGY